MIRTCFVMNAVYFSYNILIIALAVHILYVWVTIEINCLAAPLVLEEV